MIKLISMMRNDGNIPLHPLHASDFLNHACATDLVESQI